MRVVTIIAATSMMFSVQSALGVAGDKSAVQKPPQQVVKDHREGEGVSTPDPMITGVTIGSDHLEKWKVQSALYHACPKCVATQPYPGDLPEK